MSLMRSLLLAASQNRWLRDHATRYSFVRGTVSRFMPGETLDDALGAAEALRSKKIGTVFTHLGRKHQGPRGSAAGGGTLSGSSGAHQSKRSASGDFRQTYATRFGSLAGSLFGYLKNIIGHADKNSIVWITWKQAITWMLRSISTGARCRRIQTWVYALQAYLDRTKDDLAKLLPLRPSIRLVKGAYDEPPEIAFPRKQDVDENYFVLGKEMLRAKKENRCGRAAFGTHDVALIRRLSEFASTEGFRRADFEVQMLYGIQRVEQSVSPMRAALPWCLSLTAAIGIRGSCGDWRNAQRTYGLWCATFSRRSAHPEY